MRFRAAMPAIVLASFFLGMIKGQTTQVDLRNQSRSLPSAQGQTDGKVLTTGSGQSNWQSLGGDVAGTPGSVQVQRIQGRPVSSSAPASNDVLRWNSASSQWEPAAAPTGGGGSTTYTAGLGIVLSGGTIAMDDAIIPHYSKSTAAPTGPCAAGRDIHLDTGAGSMYHCIATNTWRLVAPAALSGSYASLMASNCAAVNTGQLAIPIDSGYGHLRCNGSGVWEHFAGGKRVTPPATTGWEWVNQGTAASNTVGGVLNLSAPGAGAVALRILQRSIPATPYTLTVQVNAAVGGAGNQCGLAIYETSSQKALVFGPVVTGAAPSLGLIYYSNPVTQAASVVDVPSTLAVGGQTWLRVQDDGSLLIFSGSADGLNWFEVRRETRTSHMTVAPDRAGLACNASHATLGSGIALSHWLAQ